MADVEKIAAELRAGLDACTSGPWSVDDRIVAPGDIGESWAVFESCEDDPPIIMCMEWQQEANARHIARCHPENIRALLDELSRLREERDMWKGRAEAAVMIGRSLAGRRVLSEREGQE